MMQSPKRQLVLVRHAHRDTGDGKSLDNGLSEKGKRQAERLRDYYLERFGRVAVPLFLSSPKKRCKETLAPLAAELKTKIEVIESLDEGDDIHARTGDFFKEWTERGDLACIASSHGDWIPAFVERYAGLSLSLNKGGWIELVLKSEKKFKVLKVIQDFKSS